MKILAPNFTLAEYSRSVWRITALHGQTFEQFKDPESWAHVAANFKRGDKVEVLAEDGSFFAEGIVTRLTKTSATIHFHVHVDFEEKTKPSDPDSALKFAAEWGGAAKWRIIRKSDGEVIESQIGSKEEAQSKAAKLNQEGE